MQVGTVVLSRNVNRPLNVEVGEDAIENPGELPVQVAKQQHERRDQRHPDDQGVQQHGAGEAKTEHLDHDLAAQQERAKHQHHDRSRRGDRAPGRLQTARDSDAVVSSAMPLLIYATDEKHLIVHR